jgi:hypothetical protein
MGVLTDYFRAPNAQAVVQSLEETRVDRRRGPTVSTRHVPRRHGPHRPADEIGVSRGPAQRSVRRGGAVVSRSRHPFGAVRPYIRRHESATQATAAGRHGEPVPLPQLRHPGHIRVRADRPTSCCTDPVWAVARKRAAGEPAHAPRVGALKERCSTEAI